MVIKLYYSFSVVLSVFSINVNKKEMPCLCTLGRLLHEPHVKIGQIDCCAADDDDIVNGLSVVLYMDVFSRKQLLLKDQ